jgi:hypothetical protein
MLNQIFRSAARPLFATTISLATIAQPAISTSARADQCKDSSVQMLKHGPSNLYNIFAPEDTPEQRCSRKKEQVQWTQDYLPLLEAAKSACGSRLPDIDKDIADSRSRLAQSQQDASFACDLEARKQDEANQKAAREADAQKEFGEMTKFADGCGVLLDAIISPEKVSKQAVNEAIALCNKAKYICEDVRQNNPNKFPGLTCR